MSNPESPEAQILTTYQRNAVPWIAAVREAQIESRQLVTDQAILDAVLALQPSSVLDVGCGEGWLSRALTRHGIRTLGIDGIPELVDAARVADTKGSYEVLDYAAVVRGELNASVDLIVCNFSLFGAEELAAMLAVLPSHLSKGGHLVIQTLHPHTACGDEPYVDGWRAGFWVGFSSAFRDPAPWYFRTLSSWIRLLKASGFQLIQMNEPLHPITGKPASLILIAAAD